MLCGSNRVPRSNGFLFRFVKHFWDILKKDICGFVDELYEESYIPNKYNSSFITLILKVDSPTCFKDYRTINLIGIQYEIIAKFLVNRLTKVIDSLVRSE